METLMMILTIVGILVSGIGAWLSWKSMTNAKEASIEATNAKNAAEAASQEIRVKKNIESISEVVSVIDKAISTLNKRLSGNIDIGANINTENQLLRECTALVSRNEERIKNVNHKLRAQGLCRGVDGAIQRYVDGTELKTAAEEILSGLKEIRQIFSIENESAIY